MEFLKKYKYIVVFCLTISLIVLFQEQIFNFFEKNINWRIIRIVGYFFDDSVKWSDDLFRILKKSRKAISSNINTLTFTFDQHIPFPTIDINANNISSKFQDRLSPTISITPSNNSSQISLDSIIVVTFSEPVRQLNDAEITNNNVSVLIELNRS